MLRIQTKLFQIQHFYHFGESEKELKGICNLLDVPLFVLYFLIFIRNAFISRAHDKYYRI